MVNTTGRARNSGFFHTAIGSAMIPIAILAASFMAVPHEAEGATASIGGNFYYMAWQPAWGDGSTAFVPHYFTFMSSGSLSPGFLMLYRNSARMRINDYKPIHGPMAGPSLSVSFAERWSLSSVFLAGRFIANSTGPVTRGVTDTISPYANNAIAFLTTHYRRIITRYDSDTTLACGLNRYVKLFAGFKYQGYDYNESINYNSNLGGLKARGMARFHSFGGGLGLGFTLPLAAGLFANISLSGLCMYGTASYDFDRQFVYSPTPEITPIPTQFSGERYWSAGGNSMLALAYLFEKAGVTLSLGFRYQVHYYFWQANNPKGFLDYYGRLDHSYGGTFSVIYTFGGRKAQG